MNPILIQALLTQIVIPEIAAIFRAHHNAAKTMPTDQQVLDALQFDANRYISIGEAFLASKGAIIPGGQTPGPAAPVAVVPSIPAG